MLIVKVHSAEASRLKITPENPELSLILFNLEWDRILFWQPPILTGIMPFSDAFPFQLIQLHLIPAFI